MFRRAISLLPISMLLVGVACSSSSSSTTPPAAPTSAAPTAASPAEVPVTVQQWSINAPATLPAGSTTFSVTNAGTKTHEFVVYQTDTAAADIPIESFEGEANRINEDTNGTNAGETGDLEANATKTLTVDLVPGHYVFFCNLPKHYGLGMRLDVTVA